MPEEILFRAVVTAAVLGLLIMAAIEGVLWRVIARILIGVLGVVVWVLLQVVGITVPASQYRVVSAKAQDFLKRLGRTWIVASDGYALWKIVSARYGYHADRRMMCLSLSLKSEDADGVDVEVLAEPLIRSFFQHANADDVRKLEGQMVWVRVQNDTATVVRLWGQTLPDPYDDHK